MNILKIIGIGILGLIIWQWNSDIAAEPYFHFLWLFTFLMGVLFIYAGEISEN